MAGAALADEGDRFVNDVAEASGPAIGMGLIPAACAKLDETCAVRYSQATSLSRLQWLYWAAWNISERSHNTLAELIILGTL